MTIEQLIDALSNLGATIGLKAPVKAWFIAAPEELKPLDVAKVSGVVAGWDRSAQQPIATLKLTA